MIDAHTHSLFSFDGKGSMEDMIRRGEELGLKYMCITDHCDFDYLFLPEYVHVRQIDLPKYIESAEAMKKKYPFFAMGLEMGFSEDAEKVYLERVPFERFDALLNSCHSLCGVDAYNKKFFVGRTKYEAYSLYLQAIRRSLEAKYPYTSVSHIGYVRKNAPYEDTMLYYNDFKPILDDILHRIVELDKALEINTKLPDDLLMPERDMIERFYEFGGRKITFASDAHMPDHIGRKFDMAQKIAADVGFEGWTVFRDQKPIFVPFERE